eukprot:SAG22_NODE_430_length_10586_cov_6.817202_1_plen_247_part_00
MRPKARALPLAARRLALRPPAVARRRCRHPGTPSRLSSSTASDTEAVLSQIQPGAGPLEAYNELVASGTLKEDEGQAAAMVPLQAAFETLMADKPRAHTVAEFVEDTGDGVSERRDFAGLQSAFDGITSLFGGGGAGGGAAAAAAIDEGPRGVYLYGGVGSGKTLLMDIFYRCVAGGSADRPAGAQSRPGSRLHFHSFMLRVHRQMYLLRAQGKEVDPLPLLADQLLAERGFLLCFDEFQVSPRHN